jgi:hypothetical protein
MSRALSGPRMSSRPIYARPHLRSCGEMDSRRYSKPISDARLRKAAMEHYSSSRQDENHKKHHKETDKVPNTNGKRQKMQHPIGLLISGSGVRVPARVQEKQRKPPNSGGFSFYRVHSSGGPHDPKHRTLAWSGSSRYPFIQRCPARCRREMDRGDSCSINTSVQ